MTGTPGTPVRWWAEWQFWLVLLLMAAAILPRLNDIPFRGEEHRRAQVTEEMAIYGDWVVPRDQGDVFYSRPPLQQWLVAGAEWAFQSRDRWVVRFPCAVALLLTCVLLYGYSRQFVGPTGATVAAFAYGTIGEVLDLGQQAETEALFVFTVASSLLLWHWGYARKWPAALPWMAAYAFAVASGLLKGGLQPPVYLLGTVGLYLLWKRDVRFAFTRGHLIGLIFGLALAAAWWVPCVERVGFEATRKVWMTDTSSRFLSWKVGDFLRHLVVFPTELFGCLLPWGLLIPAALLPGVRRAMAGCDAVAFCGFALVVAVPTIWIPPNGLTRYLVPIYPCFAVLVGVFAERLTTHAEARVAWRWYAASVAGLLAAIAVALVGAVWVLPGTELARFALPLGRTLAYGAALLALAAVLWKLRRDCTPRGVVAGAVTVAVAIAVLITGVFTDSRVAHTNDIAAAVAPLKEKVPADARLAAVGEVHASVRYHMGQVVPRAERVPLGAYFCVQVERDKPTEIPFRWEEVGRVSVDRFRGRPPQTVVVIGRRLPPPTMQ